MGQRGPAPKPTTLKELAGNPGKHRLPPNEPKPPVKLPEPPNHLSPVAREAWYRFGRYLEKLGVLTELDAVAFERGCEVYAEVCELQKDIRENGRAQKVETKSGDIMERARPQVQMYQNADQRLKLWLVQFGMTPASRSNVHGEAPEDDSDPAAEFFPDLN